jgi:hypothetical protein
MAITSGDFIPDPFLPQGPAIDAETGKMAASVFHLVVVEDIEKGPTAAELKSATHLGWEKKLP